METVVCAAILRTGQPVPDTVPAPGRHHNIIHMLASQGVGAGEMTPDTQGFVTSTGRFVDRVEACQIARSANQLIREPTGDFLTSEDVW